MAGGSPKPRCISPVRPNRVTTRRSGSCSTRCARPNSARPSGRSLDLLSELVDILPPTDPRWLDVLEAMYWQAEWVVDHRAETRAETAIRALRAIDGLLADSPDDARRATVKFRLANFLAWGTGELPEAEHACREAVRLFEAAGEQRQALLARREIGWIRYLRGDIAGMAAESARVVEAADALGRPVRGDARASRVSATAPCCGPASPTASRRSAVRWRSPERGREGLPADRGAEPAGSRSSPCRAAARSPTRCSSRPGR